MSDKNDPSYKLQQKFRSKPALHQYMSKTLVSCSAMGYVPLAVSLTLSI